MRKFLWIGFTSSVALFGWLLFNTLNSLTPTISISLKPSISLLKTINSISKVELKQIESEENIESIELGQRIASVEKDLKRTYKKDRARKLNIVVATKKKIEPKNEVKVVEVENDKFDFSIDVEKYEEEIKINYKPIEIAYVDFKYNEQKEILVADNSEALTKIQEKLEEIDEKLLILEDDELLKSEDKKYEDEVKTSMAKSIAPIEPAIAKIEDDLNDEDLNVYEYSKEEKVAEEKKPNVLPGAFVIPSANKKEETTKSQNIQNLSINSSEYSAGPSNNNGQTSVPNQPPLSESVSGFMANNQVSTQVQITGLGFNLKNGITNPISQLDIANLFDQGQYLAQDKKDNYIIEAGFTNVLVEKDRFISTLTSITQESEYKIPLIEKENFEEFLLNERLELNGGFALIKIDENIKDVQLDQEEERRYYLDSKLKITKKESAKFILLVNVETGNRLVQITKTDNTQNTYIVQVIENVLSYDESLIQKIEKINLELVTEELMGQSAKALNLESEQIVSLNSGAKAIKLNMNTFSFDNVAKKEDQKLYFDLNLDSYPVFIGLENSKRVLVPSKDYRLDVMNQLNIAEPKQACVIQINVKNKIDSYKGSFLGKDGVESIDVLGLDKDGSWGSDLTDTTKKIFITKESTGTVNLQFKYTNGATENLQTFCSVGSYLIEQL